MRPVLRLCTLVAFPLILGTGLAHAIGPVPVDAFHPSQPKVSFALVRKHVREWKRDAKRRGMSLKRYAKEVIQEEFNKTKVPSFIKPDGDLDNTDSHHHMDAAKVVQAKTGFQLVRPVKVLKDYTGWDETAYAEHVVNVLKKGWFGKKMADRSPLAKVRSWPKTYAQLKNDPLRGAVDNAFSRLGLPGTLFTDYIEFKVGDALAAAGIHARLREEGLIPKGARSIPDKLVFKKKIAKQIIKMMREPAIRELMLKNARNEEARKRIESALDG